MSEHVTSSLDPKDAIKSHLIKAGDPFMIKIHKGQTFRILDLEGNQAVDTLFYNADDIEDRYSATNTIMAQGRVYLTTGTKLISTEGNHMLSIVADTCGRHDTLGGACAAESNTVRYALNKKFMHNCRDNYLIGISRWGESEHFQKSDIDSNINFFMNVPVTPEGGLTFEDGISDAGKYVELKAEMDVIILISNCPQLNNPCNAYNPTPVELIVWD